MESSMSIAVFWSWQFAAACLAVNGVMTSLKWATKAFLPRFYAWKGFKDFMRSQNLLWGIVTAIPSGFLPGDTFLARAPLGASAGVLSVVVYHAVIKRIRGGEAPNGSADAE